jgi:plasmid stabilization system protein ParE
MKYHIILQPGAAADVEQIIGYLAERSQQGAAAWRNAWSDLVETLRQNPEIFPLAPESIHYDDAIREALFRTRRGRIYRALFVAVHDVVHIIHVRGPGQDLVPPDELSRPS